MSGSEWLGRAWVWPWGALGVAAILLAWWILPGAGGAAWLWLPVAFAYGAYVAWRGGSSGLGFPHGGND